MKINKNREHWNKVGPEYSRSWYGLSKKYMSQKETDFINNYLSTIKVKKALDIGIGNGRILTNYLQNTKKSLIFGIDISEKMVEVCKKKFGKNKSTVKLAVCDFSRNNLPFTASFDFVTAIRVIKYNKNWPEMISKISHLLNKNGIAVFSMLNKYSLNIFSFQKIPFYRSSKKELENICKLYNLEILDMQSFTRIPDIFYNLFNKGFGAKCIIGLEIVFSKIFGKTLLGRMLFLAVRKKT